jgi:hypothetical protein
MADIFQNSTKKIPTQDAQIVRVDMEQLDIGGRKSHLPAKDKSEDMAIKHVAGSGGK